MQIPNSLIKAGRALDDRYFDLPGLAIYSGLSVSSLRYHIKENGLPAYSIPGKNDHSGKLLVKQSEYDKWLKSYKWQPEIQDQDGNSKADQLLSRLK